MYLENVKPLHLEAVDMHFETSKQGCVRLTAVLLGMQLHLVGLVKASC